MERRTLIWNPKTQLLSILKIRDLTQLSFYELSEVFNDLLFVNEILYRRIDLIPAIRINNEKLPFIFRIKFFSQFISLFFLWTQIADILRKFRIRSIRTVYLAKTFIASFLNIKYIIVINISNRIFYFISILNGKSNSENSKT
jgi:hypothetical protein